MSENEDAPKYVFENMVGHFNTGELRELAFAVNVDWEELQGEIKSGKVISLLRVVSNRNDLPRLIALLKEKRTFVDWPSLQTIDLDNLNVEHGNVGKNVINVSGGGTFTIQGTGTQEGDANEVNVSGDNSKMTAGKFNQRNNSKS